METLSDLRSIIAVLLIITGAMSGVVFLESAVIVMICFVFILGGLALLGT